MMAHKGLKPPIEPLSEETWQRLEDAVIDRLRSQRLQRGPSKHARIALYLAAASLFGSGFALVATTDGTPRSVAVQTTSHVADTVSNLVATSTPVDPALGMGAEEFEEQPSKSHPIVATGSEHITYELGGSQLTVAPGSKVQYHGSDAEGWLVVVEDGSVHCDVTPRQGRPDFVVRAGTVEVRVVGTRFDVALLGGQASVRVDEGKVLVREKEHNTLLGAGQEWSEAKGGRVASDQQPSGTPPLNDRASAREDYELAASLESSEPSRALSIYRRLSSSGGPWAANALYARARLLKEGGRDAEARALLNRYLKLYPRGANSADARRLLNR